MGEYIYRFETDLRPHCPGEFHNQTKRTIFWNGLLKFYREDVSFEDFHSYEDFKAYMMENHTSSLKTLEKMMRKPTTH